MPSRPNFDRLVAPPRAVPLSLRVNALFGNGLSVCAWILLLFSTPAFWGFAANAEVLAPVVLRAGNARTDGRVIATEKTLSSEGKTPVHRVDYSYQSPSGQQLTGSSYLTTRSPPAVGALVPVEYVPSRPSFSRIVGMRRARFGAAAGVAILFPVLTGLFVAFSLSQGRRTLRLLREGVVDPSLKQMALYLPGRTGTAELVDELPKLVIADERGELAAGPGIRWAVLALPIFVILVNGACALNHLR